MGNTIEVMGIIREEHSRIFEILHLIKNEMNHFQNRLAGLERDFENISVTTNQTKLQSENNSTALLNLNLLEEGRSTYRKKRFHTSSTYR